MLRESNLSLEQKVLDRTEELTIRNRELKENQDRFRCLYDAAFEGINLTEKGRIIDFNNAFMKMFGLRVSDPIKGQETINFVAPEDRENVRRKMLSGYDKPFEVKGLRKDGATFPMEISGKMFSHKGREFRVAEIRDLTEQKNAEEEIKILRGILPICSFFKKIRDDKGYWEQVDTYIHKYSEATLSHSICPECVKKHYTKFLKEKGDKGDAH